MTRRNITTALLAAALCGVLLLSGCAAAPSDEGGDPYYQQKLAVVNAIQKAAGQPQMRIEIHEVLEAENMPDYDARSDCTTEYLYQQSQGSYYYKHVYTNNYNGSAAVAFGDGASASLFAVTDGAVHSEKAASTPLTALQMVDLYAVTTEDAYSSMIQRVDTRQNGENTVYTLVIDASQNQAMPLMQCDYSYEINPDGLLVAFYAQLKGEDYTGEGDAIPVYMNTEGKLTFALSADEAAGLADLKAQVAE
ncbi:MAG: hypothetical protein PHO66_03470 [Eubacteriales bacterium]|nr:hypothetical protein [Eubacteriales bacterium]